MSLTLFLLISLQDLEEAEDDAESAKYASHKKKTKVLGLEDDYYELLGLTEKRWRSSPDDIKKACASPPNVNTDPLSIFK